MKNTASRRPRAALFATALGALLALPSAASAWDLPGPNTGRWSVALFEHTWARGGSIHCQNLTTGYSCGDDNLSGMDWDGVGDANDEVSSFQLCNNTGTILNFRVGFYRDSGYRNLISNDVITVDDNECVVRNLVVGDALSSFTVYPMP